MLYTVLIINPITEQATKDKLLCDGDFKAFYRQPSRSISSLDHFTIR